jgi:hypothetical protein
LIMTSGMVPQVPQTLIMTHQRRLGVSTAHYTHTFYV